MQTSKRLEQGNIVRGFTIGNTRIKICDDCCREKTDADIQGILDRVARQAQAQLSAGGAK